MAAANVGRMAGRFAFRARAARPQFHPRSSGAQPQYQFHRSLPRSFEEARIKTRLRRELVSLFPLHNATASSRLVSLISGGSKSLECWLQHCLRSPKSVASEPSREQCFEASRSAVPLSPVPKKRNATRISLGAAVLRNFQAGFEHFSRLKDDG
ncbi:uncharacterized protein LOC112350093 isoform X5 [Selaginella moellendorffii]|uniref:uncharacterized protein LOC112348747 isoform X5 n=1 Tax=Selaginella moellendorffii TaxID=88036 RepID=UPI000D1C6C64|nr:uncharacterized protein LOC112348747 isoform X5 [Selaginella moellendorffii]XP_024541499.1 uncharacterized protein LOC112350093 isoform X5 [Selaginella moellendorffii]|eukprot:XP_024537629.1 uncharacterized protein LOC112348747 isoform X5 [Selaginella moellendorffii]